MALTQVYDLVIEKEIVTEIRSLKRGDQLAVKGEMAGIEYYHHGIFLGHAKGVADFGGNTMEDATTKIVDILGFTDSGKRQLIRILYPKGGDLPPEDVAVNAEKLVDDPDKWGKYCPIRNNCEHFAMKCKTGYSASLQVIEKLQECMASSIEAVRSAVGSSSCSSFGSISW